MNKEKLIRYGATMVVMAVAAFVLGGSIYWAPVGLVAGFLVPGILEKMRIANRNKKFFTQLMDGILLLVSCLKAGLSFTQAIEVLVEEMPDPISEEFQSVLKGLRIGITLEDAFEELYKRMPGEELKLVFSAILVARETGGDLPGVLTKLVDTLRDRNKLKENIATYTIQGRLQAVIMGCIPIVFVAVVLKQDPNHFDIMLENDLGRLMLLIAAVFQVLAIVFITKVSTIRI